MVYGIYLFYRLYYLFPEAPEPTRNKPHLETFEQGTTEDVSVDIQKNVTDQRAILRLLNL
jgi:hypothetical protein